VSALALASTFAPLLARLSLSHIRPRGRRRCRGPWLFDSRVALASLAVPFAGLPLHGDVLFRLSVAGLRVHLQLLVKKGQLLVELALGLRELVEPCRRWASVARWRGPGSGSELLDVEATQMLHSRVGSRCRLVRAL
jgi:hypothetical protein